MVIWLIGQSGAGKTTIGKEVQKLWSLNGRKAILVDGDSFREIMGDDYIAWKTEEKTPDE